MDTFFTPDSGRAPADAAGEGSGSDPHLSILAYKHRLSRRKKAAPRAALLAAPDRKFSGEIRAIDRGCNFRLLRLALGPTLAAVLY